MATIRARFETPIRRSREFFEKSSPKARDRGVGAEVEGRRQGRQGRGGLISLPGGPWCTLGPIRPSISSGRSPISWRRAPEGSRESRSILQRCQVRIGDQFPARVGVQPYSHSFVRAFTHRFSTENFVRRIHLEGHDEGRTVSRRLEVGQDRRPQLHVSDQIQLTLAVAHPVGVNGLKTLRERPLDSGLVTFPRGLEKGADQLFAQVVAGGPRRRREKTERGPPLPSRLLSRYYASR